MVHKKRHSIAHDSGANVEAQRLPVAATCSAPLRCLSMEAYPQSTRHLQNRSEARVAVGTKSPIKAFPAETGILRHLRHAFRASKVAKRSGDSRNIVRRVLKPSVEVRGHFFGCSKMLRDVA